MRARYHRHAPVLFARVRAHYAIPLTLAAKQMIFSRAAAQISLSTALGNSRESIYIYIYIGRPARGVGIG